MYRALYFLMIIILPAILGWWLFIPLAILAVYLAKLPYEIIIAGLILDLVYYFGDGFIAKYFFTLFSLLLIVLALFLNSRIYWRRVM